MGQWRICSRALPEAATCQSLLYESARQVYLNSTSRKRDVMFLLVTQLLQKLFQDPRLTTYSANAPLSRLASDPFLLTFLPTLPLHFRMTEFQKKWACITNTSLIFLASPSNKNVLYWLYPLRLGILSCRDLNLKSNEVKWSLQFLTVWSRVNH